MLGSTSQGSTSLPVTPPIALNARALVLVPFNIPRGTDSLSFQSSCVWLPLSRSSLTTCRPDGYDDHVKQPMIVLYDKYTVMPEKGSLIKTYEKQLTAQCMCRDT